MNTKLPYNPVVYLIQDVAQVEQCQFCYVQGNTFRRCQRDGKYRIGMTIYLCGYHMPGVGRRRNLNNPVIIKRAKEHK